MRPTLTTPLVTHHPYGITQHPCTACTTHKDNCSTKADEYFAGISNTSMDTQAKGTTTSAQAMGTPTTEPRNAPSTSTLSAHLQSKAVTLYNVDGWWDLLIELNLLHKHPALLEQLMHGLHVWTPTGTITQSFTPPNNPSITVHLDTFNKILHKEFTKQQYIGPFIQDALETLVRPFQSSPLSIIPKSGKPGKFHLIQNLHKIVYCTHAPIRDFLKGEQCLGVLPPSSNCIWNDFLGPASFGMNFGRRRMICNMWIKIESRFKCEPTQWVLCNNLDNFFTQ